MIQLGDGTEPRDARARLMVVEDDGLVADDMEQLLASLGYGVVAATRTGEEAIREARGRDPDLALMDVRLAGDLDGIQAGRVLREELGVPVVYVTAHADDVTRERARRTIPFGYLVKPFSDRELEIAVEVALERHRLERRLRVSRDRYRRLFEKSGAGVFRANLRGEVLEVNRALARMLGYEGPEELEGVPDDDLYRDPEVREEIHRRVAEEGEVRNREVRAVRRDGGVAWLLLNAALVEDPAADRAFVLGTAIEITRRKEMEERLEDFAYHDDLTGLANRRLLEETAGRMLALSERRDDAACLLYLDLDGFKSINDRLGHRTGDAVLELVAERLAGSARGADVVARVGGDEFAILLAGVAGPRAARAAAERFVESVARPLEVEGRTLRVGSCVGVALHPRHGEDFEGLFEAADRAMYEAKREGETAVAVARSDASRPDGSPAPDAERILEDDRLRLHYQPLRDPTDGRLVGLEALVRWEDPEGRLLRAREFVPALEREGVGERLDERVLELVARQLGRWPGDAVPGWLAVNVTPASLRSDALGDRIDALLADGEIEPSGLVLELSERTASRGLADLGPRLRRLRDRGLRIALDDYGAGRSSVAHLRELPVDLLKIDRSLVGNGSGPGEGSLAGALVRFGTNLGLEVAVEGVETGAAVAWAAEAGADLVQGWAAGAPVPPEEL